MLAFRAKLPECRYEENARRAYRGNRPAIRRRRSRPKGGICLRLDAAQDKTGGPSGHLSPLSNVYPDERLGRKMARQRVLHALRRGFPVAADLRDGVLMDAVAAALGFAIASAVV